MYNRNSEFDMDEAALFIKDAVDKVKNQENPDLLNKVKKIYKKNVPFSLRMYVAAYLLKEAQKKNKKNTRSYRDFNESDNFRDNRKFRKEKSFRGGSKSDESFKEVPEERSPKQRVYISPEQSATIFISVGRNRRVFPRDLVGLLINEAGLDKERIGDIKVLANYSFVQLFSEDAQKTINALNGFEFRGRKLSASYSRQKDGDGEETNFSSDEYENIQSASNEEPFANASEGKNIKEGSSYLV